MILSHHYSITKNYVLTCAAEQHYKLKNNSVSLFFASSLLQYDHYTCYHVNVWCACTMPQMWIQKPFILNSLQQSERQNHNILQKHTRSILLESLIGFATDMQDFLDFGFQLLRHVTQPTLEFRLFALQLLYHFLSR